MAENNFNVSDSLTETSNLINFCMDPLFYSLSDLSGTNVNEVGPSLSYYALGDYNSSIQLSTTLLDERIEDSSLHSYDGGSWTDRSTSVTSDFSTSNNYQHVVEYPYREEEIPQRQIFEEEKELYPPPPPPVHFAKKSRPKKNKNSSSSKKKSCSVPKKTQPAIKRRDEQACKKIAECRLGYPFEKKVIIPFFLVLVLRERQYNPSILRWIDKNTGTFKVEDQEGVAKLWGQMTKRENTTYGNLSRSIRHHHETGYLEHDRRKLVYRFGSKFTFWK